MLSLKEVVEKNLKDIIVSSVQENDGEGIGCLLHAVCHLFGFSPVKIAEIELEARRNGSAAVNVEAQ